MPHYFITGATGFIGSEVVDDLLAHGHRVTGLVRSDASAEKLKAKGADFVRGDIEDLDSLKKGAKNADGVIHLAFIHDFTRYDEVSKIDQRAVEALLETLEGTNKPFVGISTLLNFTGLKPDNGIYYSEDVRVPQGNTIRSDTENIILEAASKGISVSVVRLPPSVHGPNDWGWIPELIELAKKDGSAYYIEDGQVYWPVVHVKDTATLIRLAAEKDHGILHAAAENIKTKDIATKIADTFKLKVSSIPKAESGEKLAHLSFFLAINSPSSSEKTQKELGWKPTHNTLFEDIDTLYSA